MSAFLRVHRAGAAIAAANANRLARRVSRLSLFGGLRDARPPVHTILLVITCVARTRHVFEHPHHRPSSARVPHFEEWTAKSNANTTPTRHTLLSKTLRLRPVPLDVGSQLQRKESPSNRRHTSATAWRFS